MTVNEDGIKWSLLKIFRETGLSFMKVDSGEPEIHEKPTLYFGRTEETLIPTFEEYLPLPIKVLNVLKFNERVNSRLNNRPSLLLPLSKEIYETLRLNYPHRFRKQWEAKVRYEDVLYRHNNSLLTQLGRFSLPKGYNVWKEKIINHLKKEEFESAIFLLNHLFMGGPDDDFEKMESELQDRYCNEFNLFPEAASYRVLVVDDFYFLHLYNFSLIERYKAKFSRNGWIHPLIHFDFECTPERALLKMNKASYSLILLDIDFGQQVQNAESVAAFANKMGIPIAMFSKFELFDEYDEFFNRWGALSRIKKDLDFKETFISLSACLERAVEIIQLDKNLKKARMIQRGFLPKRMPKIEGFDIWGRNISSLEVSGDYFDIFSIPESNKIVFCIADVCGKGLPASLLMSSIQGGLHTQIQQGKLHLHKITETLNNLVYDNNDPQTFYQLFVTLFIAVLNTKSLVLRYINAGHNYPFIVSQNGNVRELESNAIPIGLVPNIRYSANQVKLRKGAVMCMFTDGVIEACNVQGEQFGILQLVEIVRDARMHTAMKIGRTILRKLSLFSKYQYEANLSDIQSVRNSKVSRIDDDITLLLLRL